MSLLRGAAWRRLVSTPISRRFLGGAAWGFAGTVFSQGAMLVTMALIARMVGKESYGYFVVIQSTIVTFGILAGLGVGQTATRYIAALKNREIERLEHVLALSRRTVIVFGAIVSAALALFAPVLATEVLNAQELSVPLSLAAVAVFFATIDGYQKSALIGMEAMRANATATVFGALASVPILLCAAASWGLNGAAAALAASALLQAVISRYYASRELARLGISPMVEGCLNEWRVLRDFALPALLAGVMVVPAHWICQAMLTSAPGGYAQIALLGVAMQWFNAVLMMPNIASRVILPMLSQYVAESNYENARELLMLAVKVTAIVALPPVIIIAAASAWILSLYGPAFVSGWPVLVIAVLAAALVAVLTPIGNFIAARSMMWFGMLINMGWAVAFVALSRLLLDLGALGVVLGLLGAYLLHSAWTLGWTMVHLRSRR